MELGSNEYVAAVKRSHTDKKKMSWRPRRCRSDANAKNVTMMLSAPSTDKLAETCVSTVRTPRRSHVGMGSAVVKGGTGTLDVAVTVKLAAVVHDAVVMSATLEAAAVVRLGVVRKPVE